MNADEQMFWMLPITGFAVGDKEWALSEESSMIVDSGTSLCYMPKSDGKKMIKKILKGTGFNFKLMGNYFVNCDTSKYESAYFLVDGYWLEIPPQTYISDFGGRFCMLGF